MTAMKRYNFSAPIQISTSLEDSEFVYGSLCLLASRLLIRFELPEFDTFPI